MSFISENEIMGGIGAGYDPYNNGTYEDSPLPNLANIEKNISKKNKLIYKPYIREPFIRKPNNKSDENSPTLSIKLDQKGVYDQKVPFTIPQELRTNDRRGVYDQATKGEFTTKELHLGEWGKIGIVLIVLIFITIIALIVLQIYQINKMHKIIKILLKELLSTYKN